MGFWPIRARARSYLYYKIKCVYCIWLVCFSKLDFFERCGKWRLAGIDPCINIIHPANEFILLSIKNKLCIWIFFIEWLQSLLCSDKNRENSLSIVTKRYFWKDRLIHGCSEIWNFSSRVELDISRVRCPHSWDVELNTRRKIPYIQATMNNFVYCINALLIRSRLCSRFTQRTLCHSFMMLNRASLKHVKIFRNLSRVETRFLSVVIL